MITDLELTDAQLAILLLLTIEPIPLSELGRHEVQLQDVELLTRLGFMNAGTSGYVLNPAGLAYLRFLVNSSSRWTDSGVLPRSAH